MKQVELATAMFTAVAIHTGCNDCDSLADKLHCGANFFQNNNQYHPALNPFLQESCGHFFAAYEILAEHVGEKAAEESGSEETGPEEEKAAEETGSGGALQGTPSAAEPRRRMRKPVEPIRIYRTKNFWHFAEPSDVCQMSKKR